jgi:RNA polymerase sigma factor (sigma-70 family)
MTAPNEPHGNPQGAPGWQTLFVLPALGSLGLGMVLPLWFLAVTASTALSLVMCKEAFKGLALSEEQLALAFMLSAGLILSGLGASLWASLRQAFETKDEARTRGGPIRWLLRNPWWALGLVLLTLGLLLQPGRSSTFPVGVATVLLSRMSWLILTSAWVLGRLAWGSLRLAWRLARASSFMAGLVVAAGVATALGWFVFIGVIDALVQQQLPALERELGGIRRGGGTSSQATVVPALFERGQLGTLLTVPSSSTRFALTSDWDSPADIGGPGSFALCAEGLDSQLRRQAEREATRILDATEAQDVVQDVLLRLCLLGRPPALYRGYFIRSVQHRAIEWRRRAARTCGIIEVPEPACELRPDEEYLRAESARAVNKALCALDDDEETLLRWRYFEAWEYPQIASALGTTEVNARQRVSRAIKNLREAFQQRCR